MDTRSGNHKSSNEKKPQPKKKLILYVLLIGIAIASPFLIYWILQLSLNTNSPMVVVVSGSMEPTLSKGDLLFLYGKEPVDIKNGTAEDKNGDIIVFDAVGLWPSAPNEPIVHRVIDKRIVGDTWEFRTKGDANTSPDPVWISEERILGVVCGMIPFIGWIKILFTESGLLIPLIVIVLFVLIISLIWDFMKEETQKKESQLHKSDEKKEKLL
jgi:signal peptidase